MASAPPWLGHDGDRLLLSVQLQPRAARDEVVGPHGGRLRVRVGAAPVDGAANERLCRLLAREFRVPRSAVSVVRGERGRSKLVAVSAPRRRPPWLEA